MIMINNCEWYCALFSYEYKSDDDIMNVKL